MVENKYQPKILCRIKNSKDIDLSDENANVQYLSKVDGVNINKMHVVLQHQFQSNDESQDELFERLGRKKFITVTYSSVKRIYANDQTGSQIFEIKNEKDNEREFYSFPIIIEQSDSNNISLFLNELKKGKVRCPVWNEKYVVPPFIAYVNNKDIFLILNVKKQELIDDDYWRFSFDEPFEVIRASNEEFSEFAYETNITKDGYGIGFLSHEDFEELKKSHSMMDKYAIDRFKMEAQKSGLLYETKDLINFYTAMKSKGLVILAGLSGSGKTQLVKTYAKTMGMEDRSLYIPVQSSWTDDSDLLGFMNYQKNEFEPGQSGLTQFLQKAADDKNEDHLYLVEFDEMNLSRIEQYFAQFLSALEMDDEDRQIKLFEKSKSNQNNKRDNNDGYDESLQRNTIPLKHNVMFVGTINTDESTYDISDKVLDRSNVIELHLLPYMDSLNNDENTETNLSYIVYPVLDTDDQSNKAEQKRVQTEYELLWEIHEKLNLADHNIGVGWRIVNQIEEYLNNLPSYYSEPKMEISRDEGFDLQITQRILPKIKGSYQKLHNLIGDYFDVDDKDDRDKIKGSLREVLEKSSIYGSWKEPKKKGTDNSSEPFEESINRINLIAKDLEENGFTI
ncbi:McrB family protein [Companilactobacillus furfuricola]|uniref:McrB family protein n=1 Tax=Companilactobacillus furfuricola TaxID=1462575 RepID=UPI0013DDF995|nr:AAA family ATPase [Companilactobacillus furfuricola]